MSQPPAPRTFFHPASGLAILLFDWIFFGLEWELGPASLIFSCAAAFAATYAVVRRVQTRWGGDDLPRARLKALLGALAAGAPFTVAGSAVGGLILALSGLSRLRRRA